MGTIRLEDGRRVKFADNVSAPPAVPSGATGGFSLSAFRSSLTRRYPRWLLIELAKRSGGGDVVLGAPVVAYARLGSAVFLVGTLNRGRPITLSAAAGWTYPAQLLAHYDAVQVVPASVGGGAYDGWLTSIYERGGR